MSFTFPLEPNQGEIDPKSGLQFPEYQPSEYRGDIQSPIDVSAYQSYFPEGVHTEFGAEYLDPIRAQRQSGLQQFGNMINQAVVGEVVGGTLEGIGYLFDLKDAASMMGGKEADLGNFLTDIGSDLRTWTQEVTPIHQTRPGEFAPGKWSWWMGNAPSVASTLSLLIPATGTVKGVSMLGKAMGISANLGKEGKLLGMAAKGISEAVVSRHIENLMEASGKYNEVLDRYMNSGLSYEAANMEASKVASDIYNKNWVMLAQDIPQYLLLGQKFGGVTSKTTAKMAKAMGQSALNPRLQKAGAFFLDALGEGGEEGYQYLVSELSDELSKSRVDPTYKPKLGIEFTKDDEFWNSVTMGMLGAGAFQAAGSVLNNVLYGEGEDVKKIQAIQSWGPSLKFYQAKMKAAEQAGDVESFEDARTELLSTLVGKATQTKTFGQLIDTLNSISQQEVTPEAMEAYDLDEDDINGIKENFPNIIEQANELGGIIEKYQRGKVDNTLYSPEIASSLGILEYSKGRLYNKKEELKKKSAELESQLNTQGYKDLSDTGKQIKQIEAQQGSISQLQDFLKNKLKNEKDLTEEQKTHYYTKRDSIKKLYTELEEQKKKLSSDPSYTKEKKEADNKIDLTSTILSDKISVDTKLRFTDLAIENKDNTIKYFKDLQKKVNSGEKILKPEPQPKTQEDTLNVPEDTGVQKEQTVEEQKKEEIDTKDATQKVGVEDVKRRQNIIKDVDNLPNVIEKYFDYTWGKGDNPISMEDLFKDFKQFDVAYKDINNTGSLYKKGDKYLLYLDAENTTQDISSNKGEPLDKLGITVINDPIPITSENPLKDEKEEIQENKPLEVVEATFDKGTNVDINDPQKSNRYLDTSLVTGESELVYIYKDEPELVNYLENPENSLKGAKAEFYIDYDNTYYKIDKSLANQLKKGNTKVLTTEYIDNLPIKIKVTDSTGNTIPGNIYFRTTKNIPKSLQEEDADKYRNNTRSLRATILENIVNGNIVSTKNIRKDSGNLFNKVKGKKENIISAMNIAITDIELAFSIKGGAVYNRDGVLQEGIVGNENGGNIYLMTNNTPNKGRRGIHLNKTKLNPTDANIVLECFKQAYESKYNFKQEYKGNGVSEKMSIGKVLSYLVYNNKKDTDLDMSDRMITSKELSLIQDETYKQKLLDNQLYSSKNKLYFGTNKLDLRNITKEDRDNFISHALKHFNYPITKDKFKDTLNSPFKIGSIEVKEDEVGMTMEQFYVKKGYVTTDIQPDNYGNVTRNPNLYVDISNADSLEIEESPAKEEKSQASLDAAAKREQILRDNVGYYDRKYEGKLYLRGNLDKEIQWIKERIGSEVSIEVSKDLLTAIDNTGSNLAFGQLRDKSIYLYERMEAGTGYHEAFHVVSLYYLTDAQRNSIYNLARNSYNLTNKSDKEVEEFLAELFRDYVLSDGQLRIKTKSINNWFRRLLNFIKDLFIKPSSRISNLTIEKLFNDIENKKYSAAKVINKNYKKYKGYDYLRKIEGFTTEQVNNIVNQMLYQILTVGNIMKVEDVKNITFDPAIKHLIKLRDAFKELRKDDEESERLYQVYSRILNNIDYFKELISDRLYTLNIRRQIEDTEDSMGEEVRSQYLDDNSDDDSITKYDRANYEYNSRDNLLANIKLFVATLPASGKIDPYTKMPEILNFNESWSKIMKDLWSASSFKEIISILENKAEGDSYYKALLNGDPKRGRIGLKNAPKEFQNQFEIAVYKHRHNFINAIQEDGKNVKFIDAAISKAERDLTYEWSLDFYLSDKYINPDKSINKDNINKEIRKYEDIKKAISLEWGRNSRIVNPDEKLTSISELLSNIGINLNVEELINISLALSKDNKGNENIHYGIHNLVNDLLFGIYGSKGVLPSLISSSKKDLAKVKTENYLLDSKIIKLAKLSIENNIYLIDDTVLGAENATYYVYSQNNYLTDFPKLIKDKQFLNLLSNTVYNKNSYFLKQINNGAKLDVVTFGSFRKQGGSKNYLDINNKEDLLIKLNAVNKNLIPLPTLADRKAYYFYKGIKKVSLDGASINDKGKYIIPENVIDVFYGYIMDEASRIEYTKKEVDKALENNEYSKLIKNKHYKKVDSNNIPILKENGNYTGEGTKFQHFPSFNEKPIDKGIIKNILRNRVIDSLNYAKSLGIIDITKDNRGNIIKLGNKLLGKELVENYKNKFGTPTLAIYHLFAEYTVNTIASTIETEKLISGDPADYKSAEDKIKRLNAPVAPGEKILDVLEGEFKDKTSYNTAIVDSFIFDDKELYKQLEKSFRPLIKVQYPHFSEEQVEKELNKRLEGYREIDVTDAQVYVTPTMYRELRIRMGEWNEDNQRDFEKLMYGEEIINSSLVMQPLKLVYFGPKFYDNTSFNIYDKMSVAPLLPSVVKGTQLEPLYNKMISDNIDMIKYDSAVKVGNTGSIKYFDTDGNTLTNNLDRLNITSQDFKFLRKQQVTDPHTSHDRMLGTQVKKIILANLKLDEKIYSLPDSNKKFTGREIAQYVFNAYASLSNKGLEKVIEKLGIDNNKVINETKLMDYLRDSAKDGNMPYDVIDNLFVDPVTGKRNINIDTLLNRKWIESRLISAVTKDTVDLVLPGTDLIQMSNGGLVPTLEERKKHLIDRDLKLLDEKGRTEVKVSVGLFSGVIPNYENISFEQKKKYLKTILEGVGYRIPTQGQSSTISFVVKEFLPEETGNTIILPYGFTKLTGSDFDIDKLFVAIKNYYSRGNTLHTYKFYRGNENGIINDKTTLENIYKDTYVSKVYTRDKLLDIKKIIDRAKDKQIALLNAIGTELGIEEKITILQDLDIKKITQETLDKLDQELTVSTFNRLLDEYEHIPDLDKFIEDNLGKDEFKVNNEKAVQNMVIDLMSSVITNPAHLLDTKTPLDTFTSELKEMANYLKSKDSFTDLEAAAPAYQLYVKDVYTGGKMGIGPFALNNVHHALTQIVGTHIKKEEDLDPAAYYDFDLSKEMGVDDIKISDWLSALINAHVDIAKEPYIFYLNVNNSTYNIVNLLIRAGYGANSFWLINQPIFTEKGVWKKKVKNYEQAIANNIRKSSKTKEEIKIKRDEANAIIAKYQDINNVMSDPALKGYIKEENKDYKYYAKQLGIGFAIKDIVIPASKRLGKLVMSSRIDNKGFGKTLGELEKFDSDFNKLYNMDNEFAKLIDNTFLKTLYFNSIDFIKSIYSNLTIDSTKGFKEIISSIPFTEGMDVNKVLNATYSAILSQYFTSPKGFNLNQDKIKELFTGETAVGYRLREMLKTYPQLRENKFISKLKPVLDSNRNIWFIKALSGDKNDKFIRDSYTEGWKDLLTSPDEIIKKFGYDLLYYSFYTSGFNKSLYSFYQDIPKDIFKVRPGIDTELTQSFDEFITDTIKLLSEDYVQEEYKQNVVRDTMKILQEYESPINYEGDFKTFNNKKGVSLVTINPASELYHGKNSIGQPIYEKKVSISREGLNLTLEYVGFTKKSKKLVYKVITTKGVKYQGHTIIEPGYEGSVFEVGSRISEEDIKNKLNNLEGWGDFEYIEVGDREVTQTEEDQINDDAILAIGPIKVERNAEFEEAIIVDETKGVSEKDIYNRLGNKTVSDNIKIESWHQLKDLTEPLTKMYDMVVNVVSTRIKNSNEHFGNPFSSDERVLKQNPNLIKTTSTKESVEKYIDWVINSNEDRAKWIRNQIQSGDLKDKPILYYKELGEPSHATALDYLINEYDWNLQETIEESPYLSDKQIDLIKEIPLMGDIANERNAIINAIHNMELEEARKIIDQLKNCL